MGINRGLCSLENYLSPQNSKLQLTKKHKKSYEYSPKLLFIEPNKLGCILETSL